jgi:hypothetical protein
MIYYPCLRPPSHLSKGEQTSNDCGRGGIQGGGGGHALGGGGGACAGVGGVMDVGDFVGQGVGGGHLTDDMLKDFVPIRKDVEALSSWYQQVNPALIEP